MIKTIQQKLEVGSKDEYFLKHLSIINPMLPAQLTGKELEVLAAFMALPSEVTEDDTFNTLARKKVKAKLNLSSAGLSNHLGEMIKKGFLQKSEVTKRIRIREFLLPQNNAQGYQFKILLKNESTSRPENTSNQGGDREPLIADIQRQKTSRPEENSNVHRMQD